MPTKIVPPPAGDAQSSKAIQDRLANAGREQIVSKQEEPVALKDIGTQAAPRVVLPAPVAPAPVAPVPMTRSRRQRQQRAVRTNPGRCVPLRFVLTAEMPVASLHANREAPAGPFRSILRHKSPLRLRLQRTRSAAAPPPAPRAIQESPRAARSGFLVQLSSQKSEAEAAASFRSLQAKFPNELGQGSRDSARRSRQQRGILPHHGRAVYLRAGSQPVLRQL